VKVLSFDTSHPRRTVLNLTWEKENASLLLDISSSQQDKLLASIDHLLTTIGASIDKLDDIVVGIGPGSFTGLRIGLSLAKGFAWAKSIPLHAVSSLEALALSFPWECLPDATVVATTDARMKKLYACIYQAKKKILPETDISPEELIQMLSSYGGPFWFVGDNPYLSLFREKLSHTTLSSQNLWIQPEVLRDHGLSTPALSHDEILALEPLYLRKSEAENKKNSTTPSDEAR
jgi:tRNA threonylcarbamoyl adenosine modification protein YeaZ